MGARFYLHKRNDDADEVGLRLIVYRARRQVAVAIPVTVRPSDWSQSMQRVKPSTPGATDLNAELKRLRVEAEALTLRHADDKALKAALLERLGRAPADDQPTILEHFETFLSFKESRVKENTMKVFRTLEAHLKGFFGKRDPRPGEIDPGIIEDFQTYLLGKGLNNNSTNKYAARLRGFFKWLEDRDAIDAAPKVKPLKTADSHVVRLTLEELAALTAADLSGESKGHEAARDIFLMCCYTGQRVGDVVKMEWKDVQGDAWYMREEKTGVIRRVPMIAPALEIIEKRKGKRRPLPRLAPQKVNDYIKRAGEIAEINAPVTLRSQKGGELIERTVPKYEALSSHVGRKTYVSLMMEAGVSAKEMLGITHSDLRSLRRYAGASEDRLRKTMQGVFGSLTTKAG